MRHKKLGRRFSRDSSHRQAMFSNMAASLIKHEQIVTTLAKAKDLRRVMDKYVTLAKRGDLNSRRLAAARMGDEAMVKKLFETIAPRYKDRSGGYTRVMQAGYRYGDSAPVAVIEFVDRDEIGEGQGRQGARRGRQGSRGQRVACAWYSLVGWVTRYRANPTYVCHSAREVSRLSARPAAVQAGHQRTRAVSS